MQFATLPANAWLQLEFFWADWTILLNGSKAFRVNSKLLARHSRYFYEKFSAALREAQSNSGPELRMTSVSYVYEDCFTELMVFFHTLGLGQSPDSNEPVPAEPLYNDNLLTNLLMDAERLKLRLDMANYFVVPIFIDTIVSAAIKKLNSTNCWIVLSAATDPECWCTLLSIVAKDFIVNHFFEATKVPEFLTLCSGANLGEFLNNKYLNAPHETEALDIVFNWVQADPSNRKLFLGDFLRRIRYHAIPNYECKRILSHPLVRNSHRDTLKNYFEQSLEREKMIKHVRIPHQVVFLCSGDKKDEQIVNFQLFDPVLLELTAHNSFAPIKKLSKYVTCAALDNSIYVILSSSKVYECYWTEGFMAWRKCASLAFPRSRTCACALKDKIYVIGGAYLGSNHRMRSTNAVDEFDPYMNKFTRIAYMVHPRSQASCTTLNGRIYVCGGGSRPFEYYDPAQNQWTELSRFSMECSGCQLVALDGLLYVICPPIFSSIGYDSGEVTWINPGEISDEVRRWGDAVHLPYHRAGFCAVALSGCIYVFGGWVYGRDGKFLYEPEIMRQIYRWKPGENSWTLCGKLSAQFYPLASCVISGCEFIERLLDRS